MDGHDRLRAELGEAMAGAGGALAVADRLCHACVELLEIDGASISLTLDGEHRGTFGSSGTLGRHLDELQFTLGEGPCLDATSSNRPVLVEDLDDATDTRWPAFSRAVLEAGIGAVFALPVRLSAQPVGALDLFRAGRGPAGAGAHRRAARRRARGPAATRHAGRPRRLGRRRPA